MSETAEEDRVAAGDDPYRSPVAVDDGDWNAAPRSPEAGAYYGWVMIAVAAIAMVATFPGRTHGLGTVTERLLADESLGLTRLGFGQFNFWATLIGAGFCIGFGRLIDRLGMGTVLPATLLSLGAVVVAMAYVGSPWMFFLLLTLTRGFGQSALSVASISIPGKWFRDRLSWATAVYSIVLTIGFVAAFMAAEAFRDADWRYQWAGVGLLVLAFAPLAWIVTRNGPGSTAREGAARAGEEKSKAAGAGEKIAKRESLPQATGVGLLTAVRTVDFWIFAAATSLFATISSGLSLFNQSVLADLGFDVDVYYDSMKVAIGVGLLGQFFAGWAATRISMGRLTAIGLAGLAVALVLVNGLYEEWHVMLFAAGNAFAGGIVTVIFFAVWAKRFGRRHLGSIQGAAQMTTVLASALGPLLFASVRASFGSYTPILFALAAASAALAVAAFLVPQRTFDDGANSDAAPSPA